MTVSTHPIHLKRLPRGACALAWAGVLLGICAGLVQLTLGATIPQWTGDKMDPAGLGLTTIVLSLVAAAALWQLRRPLPAWARVACVLASVACAAVCFSTVGRLWYVPGPLLLLATALAVVDGAACGGRPGAGAGARTDRGRRRTRGQPAGRPRRSPESVRRPPARRPQLPEPPAPGSSTEQASSSASRWR